MLLILNQINHAKSHINTAIKLNCRYEDYYDDELCSVQNDHYPGIYIVDLQNGSQTVTKLEFLNSTFHDIPEITSIGFLEFWKMEEVQLQQINRVDFQGATSLKHLSLANNKIKELPDQVFGEAFELETIDLGYNLIMEVSMEAFAGVPKLKNLYLHNNQITTIQSESFLNILVNLEDLSLKTNWLRIINEGLFDQNQKLTKINLKNNYIHQIHPQAFSMLPHLTILNLERNSCIIGKIGELSSGTDAEDLIVASECLEKVTIRESASITILSILGAVLLGTVVILPIIVLCFFGFQGAYLASS